MPAQPQYEIDCLTMESIQEVEITGMWDMLYTAIADM